jgi:hypothetical protein
MITKKKEEEEEEETRQNCTKKIFLKISTTSI